MNNLIYQTNATKGMQLMNEVNGRRWVLDFDLESFDITIPQVCVVGLYYGDYDQGLRELFADYGTEAAILYILAATYGFDSEGGNFRQLQAEWTALISDQKAELLA